MPKVICEHCENFKGNMDEVKKHESDCEENPEVVKRIIEKIDTSKGICITCENKNSCPMKQEDTYSEKESPEDHVVERPDFVENKVDWCPYHHTKE